MIAETPFLQTKYNQLLSRNWQKHFSYKLNIIKSVSTPRHNIMSCQWQYYSAWVCSDDNGNVHSVIWLLSAEYCQCQQSSGAPASHWIWSPPTLEPPRVRSVGCRLVKVSQRKISISRYPEYNCVSFEQFLPFTVQPPELEWSGAGAQLQLVL